MSSHLLVVKGINAVSHGEAVKKRMHLVYEVNRGSFDRAKASSKRVTDRTQRAGSGVT